MPACSTGCGKKAVLKRPKTSETVCKECFFRAFEDEVHQTITSANLFQSGEYVAIAASGGKDSTVLAHIMKLLNERHNYGLKLVLLSIDEGITGYRDDSLETVKRNEQQYGIPLKILSYEELYGWTMDKIVEQVGRKNNCTFCGVFRRQALDRGAALLGVDKLVTGHNADDIAETVLMNVLRGDIARLGRCTDIQTGSSEGSIPRSKPLKYTYEKEIVLYAYYKNLDYFSTECIYSPNAYRGYIRAYLKDMERIRPSSIIDVIHSGECLGVKDSVGLPSQSTCTQCGHVSSGPICKACQLLEGLNRGKPKLGIGKSSKIREAFSQAYEENSDRSVLTPSHKSTEIGEEVAMVGSVSDRTSHVSSSSKSNSKHSEQLSSHTEAGNSNQMTLDLGEKLPGHPEISGINVANPASAAQPCSLTEDVSYTSEISGSMPQIFSLSDDSKYVELFGGIEKNLHSSTSNTGDFTGAAVKVIQQDGKLQNGYQDFLDEERIMSGKVEDSTEGQVKSVRKEEKLPDSSSESVSKSNSGCTCSSSKDKVFNDIEDFVSDVDRKLDMNGVKKIRGGAKVVKNKTKR